MNAPEKDPHADCPKPVWSGTEWHCTAHLPPVLLLNVNRPLSKPRATAQLENVALRREVATANRECDAATDALKAAREELAAADDAGALRAELKLALSDATALRESLEQADVDGAAMRLDLAGTVTEATTLREARELSDVEHQEELSALGRQCDSMREALATANKEGEAMSAELVAARAEIQKLSSKPGKKGR